MTWRYLCTTPIAGRPYRQRGWVTDGGTQRPCCERAHRTIDTALRCVKRAMRQLNRGPVMVCPVCQGRGYVADAECYVQCDTCHGSGEAEYVEGQTQNVQWIETHDELGGEG